MMNSKERVACILDLAFAIDLYASAVQTGDAVSERISDEEIKRLEALIRADDAEKKGAV